MGADTNPWFWNLVNPAVQGIHSDVYGKAPQRSANSCGPSPYQEGPVPYAGPHRYPRPRRMGLTQSEAIHRATYSSYAADVEKLLDQGADTGAQASLRNGKLEVEAHRLTPLHLAAGFNPDLEVAALLLDQGADIEAHQNGWTALHFAAQFDLPEIAEVLLDQGADSKATNNNGQTPCQVARQLNSFAGTQLLGRLCRP